MNKKEKHLEKWKRMKSKGLLMYIFKMGILYYALSFFLIWVLLVPFIDSSFTLDFINKETFTDRVIVFGIISPLFGILLGYIWWKGFEGSISS